MRGVKAAKRTEGSNQHVIYTMDNIIKDIMNGNNTTTPRVPAKAPTSSQSPKVPAKPALATNSREIARKQREEVKAKEERKKLATEKKKQEEELARIAEKERRAKLSDSAKFNEDIAKFNQWRTSYTPGDGLTSTTIKKEAMAFDDIMSPNKPEIIKHDIINAGKIRPSKTKIENTQQSVKMPINDRVPSPLKLSLELAESTKSNEVIESFIQVLKNNSPEVKKEEKLESPKKLTQEEQTTIIKLRDLKMAIGRLCIAHTDNRAILSEYLEQLKKIQEGIATKISSIENPPTVKPEIATSSPSGGIRGIQGLKKELLPESASNTSQKYNLDELSRSKASSRSASSNSTRSSASTRSSKSSTSSLESSR